MVYVLVILQIIAGLIPFIYSKQGSGSFAHKPIPFPVSFEGNELFELELDQKTKHFSKSFPGEIKIFTDGAREFVFRHVRRASRKLHPAQDCFKGSGYSVRPLPLRRDGAENLWGCFEGSKGEVKLEVCERIHDFQGRSYSDTSAWFWAAVLGETKGPWEAVTVISERSAGAF